MVFRIRDQVLPFGQVWNLPLQLKKCHEHEKIRLPPNHAYYGIPIG